MVSRADRVAQAVIARFDALPAKRKPSERGNGVREWVPLSGIVAEQDEEFTCLALATGMKCLPTQKIPQANGVGIHDWHAEVLAIRTFNRLLLDECHAMILEGRDSSILTRTNSARSAAETEFGQPFRIKGDVKLHMYCSEAPCGDASMELIMAAQEDPTAWELPRTVLTQTAAGSATGLPGRAYFSELGIVRRKPARSDALPTLSKSCSDKLAMKQCTSLLCSLTSLFINPTRAYIESLVLPGPQYASEACVRAFSKMGRMAAVDGQHWHGGYSFHPFAVEATDLEFLHSRIKVHADYDNVSPSNLAATWSLSGFEESIIGGVIQGRKAFDPRGASQVSRRRMWKAARDCAALLEDSHATITRTLLSRTYRQVKAAEALAVRRKLKADVRENALHGWTVNQGDSDFEREDLIA